MSITDVLGRISQIQTDISALSDPSILDGAQSAGATAPAPASNATTGAANTQFASALTGATSSAPVSATSGQLVQNGTTGADIVADAQKYLGVPYVFGGTTTSGMDCSGLVQTVFKDMGISMPRVVPDQAAMGQNVGTDLSKAQPGDLIIEKGSGHIQIYAGNGNIIEAPRPGENVVERKEWLSPDQIGSIQRIVPATAADESSAGQLASAQKILSASGIDLGSLLSQYTQGLSGTAASSGLGSLLNGSGADTSSLESLLSGSGTSGVSSLLGGGDTGDLSSLLGGMTGSSSTSSDSLVAQMLSGGGL